MIVHQVLCAAGPVDAVTNQGLAWRRVFDSWGWKGGDFAEVLAPGMDRRSMRPLKELEPAAEDILVVHYSGWAPRVDELLETPNRSLVISHNITPARYFWSHEPVEGVRCSLAPAQLASIAARADMAAGVSRFNADELGDGARVIPILFDRSRLPAPGAPPSGPPTVLFVGRLSPHKRQDLVIRAVAKVADARLVLVGVPITPEFEADLRALADELAPGRITIEGGIPADRLWEHYRSAHAFLCLSEHEGFCIPLLEAFHFGVPVIARPVGGIPEVVDDAGVLLSEDDDLEVVAELLGIVMRDEELRSELAGRAERRLEHYSAERVQAAMREAIEAL